MRGGEEALNEVLLTFQSGTSLCRRSLLNVLRGSSRAAAAPVRGESIEPR